MTVRDQMTGASGEISNVRAAITNGEPAENDFSENTVEWNDRAKMFVLNGIIPIDGRATIIYDYVVTAEDAGSTIKIRQERLLILVPKQRRQKLPREVFLSARRL